MASENVAHNVDTMTVSGAAHHGTTTITKTTVTTVMTVTTITTMGSGISSAEVTTTMTSTIISPSNPFRFMDLPMEIRYQIYEELVVVGKVFYEVDALLVYNENRARERSAYRRPDLAILRVSKAVHEEAENIYLSKNQFILPSLFRLHQPFNADSGAGLRKLFSSRALRVIKHVSFDADARAAYIHAGFPYSTWDVEEAEPQGFVDRTAISARLDSIHGEASALYIEERSYLTDSIQRMNNLSTMEIDFSCTFCLFGCCRMTNIYHARLAHAISRLRSVRILGLRNQEEQNIIMHDWAAQTWQFMLSPNGYGPRDTGLSVQELFQRYHITFGEEGDPWAKYKINGEDALGDCDSMVND